MNQDISTTIKQLSEPLYQSRKWIKMAGILSIVTGAFQVLTLCIFLKY